MPLFRAHSPPRPAPQMPLTRAPQYNEEAAPRSTIFTHRNPERLRPESMTGSYFSNDSRGALVTQPSPKRRGGLLRRHSSDSVPSDHRIVSVPRRPPSRGLGGSTLEHRSTVGVGHAAGGGTPMQGRRGHMHDKSLLAAREKVRLAETAERGADQALVAARRAVGEARRHLQILEAEANEQARLAHERILGVRSLKNDARGLGRYGSNA